MATSLGEKEQPTCLGFLTTLGNSHDGVIGGFLVLNVAGRPIEFHCTAPIRPNRAQEILYGATLDGFLCGEQIAPALVGRTKAKLLAVLTNSPNALTAQPLIDAPLGIVFRHATDVEQTKTDEQYAYWEKSDKDALRRKDATSESNANARSEGTDDGSVATEPPFFYESLVDLPFVPSVDYARWRETIRGKNRIALPVARQEGQINEDAFGDLTTKLDKFLKSIDSVEPFERIRLAIEEAQKSC